VAVAVMQRVAVAAAAMVRLRLAGAQVAGDAAVARPQQRGRCCRRIAAWRRR